VKGSLIYHCLSSVSVAGQNNLSKHVGQSTDLNLDHTNQSFKQYGKPSSGLVP
jgi:hypothetical protein